MLLAHPLTQESSIGLPPLVLALLATVVVAAALTLLPIRRVHSDDRAVDDANAAAEEDSAVPLRPAQLISRAVVVTVLVLGLYAARRGATDGVSNIAPALFVGVAWPFLILGAVSLRRLWQWLDPWDAIARAVEPLAGGAAPAAPPDAEPDPETDPDPDPLTDPDSDPETDPGVPTGSEVAVWPGVAAAAAVMYFLVAKPDSTQPRAVGAALASYTIVMVAVGVALGRATLARVELFGMTARWAGQLRDGFAARWQVPRGAEVVLGVLTGGLLFDLARRTPGYDEALRTGSLSSLSTGDPLRDVRVGLAVSCVLGAVIFALGTRWADRRGEAGSVAVAVLPVVLALLVVAKLRRFLVSAQLLRILVSDPLGRGKDYFGTAGASLDANPFGTTAQRVAAIVIVTAAGVVGAVALRRRTRSSRERDPASYVLYLLVALAVCGLSVAA